MFRAAREGQNNTGFLTTIESSAACGSCVTWATLNLLFSLQGLARCYNIPTQTDLPIRIPLPYYSPALVCVSRLCKPTFHCCVVCLHILKQPVPVHLGAQNVIVSLECRHKVTVDNLNLLWLLISLTIPKRESPLFYFSIIT